MNDLLDAGQMQREWDLALTTCSLELVPDDEVALVVEHEQVTELIEEHVEVLELAAPGLSKIYEGQRTRLLDEDIH